MMGPKVVGSMLVERSSVARVRVERGWDFRRDLTKSRWMSCQKCVMAPASCAQLRERVMRTYKHSWRSMCCFSWASEAGRATSHAEVWARGTISSVKDIVFSSVSNARTN